MSTHSHLWNFTIRGYIDETDPTLSVWYQYRLGHWPLTQWEGKYTSASSAELGAMIALRAAILQKREDDQGEQDLQQALLHEPFPEGIGAIDEHVQFEGSKAPEYTPEEIEEMEAALREPLTVEDRELIQYGGSLLEPYATPPEEGPERFVWDRTGRRPKL